MLYNIKYVIMCAMLCYITCVMLCHVMLCYVTCVMLCYIKYVSAPLSAV